MFDGFSSTYFWCSLISPSLHFPFLVILDIECSMFVLFHSLYAMLHAEKRALQTLLSTDPDDSTFKLFGKFGLSHLQQEIRQQFDESIVTTNRNTDTTNTSRITRTKRHRQQHHHQQLQRWRCYACLLFSILSGLLAGLFELEHLINLLSIGTLLMLFALTIDIMMLR